MGRPNRISFPGMLTHVIVRGNNKKKIFREDDDYRYLIELLRISKKQMNFKIFTFCLMPNHFHLFMQTGNKGNDCSISNIMQKINLKYVKFFNKKYQRSGHLFNNRFKSIIVQSGTYATNLMRYIDMNPCKLNSTFRENPFIYKWSGIMWTCKGKGPYADILDVIPWLSENENIELYRSAYAEFIREKISVLNFFNSNLISNANIIGNNSFIKIIVYSYENYWKPSRKKLDVFIKSVKKSSICGLAFKFV